MIKLLLVLLALALLGLFACSRSETNEAKPEPSTQETNQMGNAPHLPEPKTPSNSERTAEAPALRDAETVYLDTLSMLEASGH